MSSSDYRQTHRAELAEKQRAWRAEHPDYMRTYRKEHAADIAQSEREWRRKNADHVNEQRRLRKGDRAVVRRAMLEATAEERYRARLAKVKEWQRSHPERTARYKRYNQTRRARLLGAFVERIDRLLVYEIEQGICGICGDPVPVERFHLDHIIPLSRGGLHAYGNVQIAHPSCNTRKHNSLPVVAA